MYYIGVMNTDNFSIFSISIDLNVYGYINDFDPTYTPNFIDTERRYAFGRQSSIAIWYQRCLLLILLLLLLLLIINTSF